MQITVFPKKEIQTISAKISDLESKKLTASGNINLESAMNLGFVEVKHRTFIMNRGIKTAYSN